MAYRHIAQGELDGQPYAVAYCGVCNVAIGLTPVVDGRVYHFSLGGVYNAMMLMMALLSVSPAVGRPSVDSTMIYGTPRRGGSVTSGSNGHQEDFQRGRSLVIA